MKVSQIKPMADNVLVEPSTKEEVTASGIVIPDTASKERPEQGKVLAVGPGAFDESGKRVLMEVEKGQTVMFTKYGPNEIKVDNKEYLLVRQKDILAVINTKS